MADNQENAPFGNFSIQDTMEMGMGNSELLNDLMSPETASGSPDDVSVIKPEEPAAPKKAAKTQTTSEEETSTKEDSSKSIQDFLLGGDSDDEDDDDEAPAIKPKAKPVAEVSNDEEEEKMINNLTDFEMNEIAEDVNDMADNDLSMWLREALDKVIENKKVKD